MLVGTNPQTIFNVHENIICKSSDFFSKAVKGGWKESKDRSVELPDETPDTFGLYLHWLYRGTIPTKVDEAGAAGTNEYNRLARAFILGDKTGDGDFQDAVIDAMISKNKTPTSNGDYWSPERPTIELIYENTLQSSKARKWLVDTYIRSGSSDWMLDRADAADWPHEFLLELSAKLLGKTRLHVKDGVEEDHDPCLYHHHDSDDKLCYRFTRYKDRTEGSREPSFYVAAWSDAKAWQKVEL